MNISQQQFKLRMPSPRDGASVFHLVSQCPPLDINSMYCYLLQCTHFADTSVAAVQSESTDEEVLGFISGYLIPERKNTLFIWQVAVSEAARGRGLALAMLQHILERLHCGDVSYLETTITEPNRASWALFESLSKKLNTTLEKSIMFDRDDHLVSDHDTEYLARLGPFKSI